MGGLEKSGRKYGEGCFAEEGVDCSKVGICYEIRCTMCDENDKEGPTIRPPQNTQARMIGGVRRGNRKIYIGNTGKTGHSRMKEHEKKLNRKDKSSCLYKHVVNEHTEGETPVFKMKTLSTHRTNLQRMIAEGISIERVQKENPDQLLNSKAEWGRTKLVRHLARPSVF